MDIDFTPEGDWFENDTFESRMEMRMIEARLESEDEQIPGQLELFDSWRPRSESAPGPLEEATA